MNITLQDLIAVAVVILAVYYLANRDQEKPKNGSGNTKKKTPVCQVCQKPADTSLNLPVPMCTEHGRVFLRVLLSDSKKKKVSGALRRRVIRVLSVSPKMKAEEISKLLGCNPHSVRIILQELGKGADA